MSREVETALGIGSPKSSIAEPSGPARESAPVLYRVRKGDTVQGPYTLRQLSVMWQSGGLTADAEYATDGATEWKPLLRLMEDAESRASGSPSPVDSLVTSLALQQKLKSPTVAVVLALFLPFVGAFYGSALAALVPLFVGVPISFLVTLWLAHANSWGNAEVIPVLFGLIACFGVWSVFWSLSAVRRHNARVLADAQKNRS
jgi:hypothetical protein